MNLNTEILKKDEWGWIQEATGSYESVSIK
jgi:hypothetical protein